MKASGDPWATPASTPPAEPNHTTGMKHPPRRDASPPPGTRHPEYVLEVWVSPQLRDRIQHTGAAPAEAGRAGKGRPRERTSPQLEDLEAEP